MPSPGSSSSSLVAYIPREYSTCTSCALLCVRGTYIGWRSPLPLVVLWWCCWRGASKPDYVCRMLANTLIVHVYVCVSVCVCVHVHMCMYVVCSYQVVCTYVCVHSSESNRDWPCSQATPSHIKGAYILGNKTALQDTWQISMLTTYVQYSMTQCALTV